MRNKWQQGSLKQTGKLRKVWRARFRVSERKPDGTIVRRQVERIIGAVAELPTKQKAMSRLREIIRDADGGPPVMAATFGEFVERWREAILPRFKYSTRKGYESLLRLYILPRFDRMSMSEISVYEVQSLATAFGRNHAPETTKRVVDLLSGMFRVALKWGWVQQNPCKGVELPRRYRRPQAAVDMETAARLIGAVEEPYSLLLTLFAVTALRRSEIFALRWRSVDYRLGGLQISEAVVEGQWDAPKAQGSIKFFPLPPWIMARLEAQWRAAGCPQAEQPIFATAAGTALNPSNVLNRVVWPACDRLGIKRCGFHAFRRGAATALIASGADPKSVQLMLGHQDPATTLRHYAMIEAERLRPMVEEFAEKLRGNEGKLRDDPSGATVAVQ